MTEKQRIREIIKGDTSAFGYFVDTYQDMAVSIAFRICKNKVEAEDIAQNSFVKAFRNLHAFKRRSKFSTWFYRIVYNTAISEVRKSVHKTEFVDYKHTNLKAAYSEFDTSAGIAEKEQKQMIEEAMSKIPGSEAVVLTLFYLEENSIKEVAKIMGLTPSNVKVKLHRGRKNLAKVIKKENIL